MGYRLGAINHGNRTDTFGFGDQGFNWVHGTKYIGLVDQTHQFRIGREI